MLGIIGLVLTFSALVNSLTVLQTMCTGTGHVYNDSSCYVLNKTLTKYSKAKISCEHYLGYSGHLIFIRNASVMSTLTQLMTSNNLTVDVYVGLEQTNTSGLRNASWAFAYKDGSTTTASYFPWKIGAPSATTTNNRAMFKASTGIYDVAGESISGAYVCQYEESLMQPVTALETSCAAISSTHVYTNGHCYTWHDTPTMSYYGAKLSCKEIPYINGHLIHIQNNTQQQMLLSMMRATGTASFTWVGMEQTNASAPDTVLPGSWYYATPQDRIGMITFLPWVAGQPNGGTSCQFGMYSLPDKGLWDKPSTDYYSYACEYETARQKTTDLESSCDTVGTSTGLYTVPAGDRCYIMHPAYLYYDVAKKNCNDIIGYTGHLLHIRNASHQAIAVSLMSAASYVPTAWVGLEHLNVSTPRSTGWYYTTPQGNNQLASFLPWYASRPSASTTLNNIIYYNPSGGINADGIYDYANTTSYPYICEYDCAINTTWTAWSACSQTCDIGVRSRVANISSTCSITTPQTIEIQYESCASGVHCRGPSTKVTALQSACNSQANSYYAYSSCFFFANITGMQSDANNYCLSQGAQLASLFGPDLIEQLGALFLNLSSIQAWVNLEYTGANFQWSVNNTQYSSYNNITAPPAGLNCVALVADQIRTNMTENPRLTPMDCTASLTQAICMKSDNIYSSYSFTQGQKIIETQLPESVSIAVDFNDCGARCSEIIGCVGFNFSPRDGSCIPTKVCLHTPSVINGVTVYSIQVDPLWIFYDRL